MKRFYTPLINAIVTVEKKKNDTLRIGDRRSSCLEVSKPLFYGFHASVNILQQAENIVNAPRRTLALYTSNQSVHFDGHIRDEVDEPLHLGIRKRILLNKSIIIKRVGIAVCKHLVARFKAP